MSVVLKDDESTFTLADIQADVKMILLDHPDVRQVQMPPRYVYGFRAYWGMFALLAGLGARANWRNVTIDILAEIAGGP